MARSCLRAHVDAPPLGVVQGMITGIRGLCNGLGPALYGFVFYLFHVELNEMASVEPLGKSSKANMANPTDEVGLGPQRGVSVLVGVILEVLWVSGVCTEGNGAHPVFFRLAWKTTMDPVDARVGRKGFGWDS